MGMPSGELKCIQQLLDECRRAGSDCYGDLHYIKQEVYEDAQREFNEWCRNTAKRTDTK